MSSTRRVASSRPTFEHIPDILRDVQAVLASGRLMLGPYLEAFESAFAQACGTRYAIGVASCTSALEIALRHLRVEGAEVVVPANTFVATANAVLFAGGTPVFADIQEDTLCLDPRSMQHALTGRTKAVIAVHVAGLVSPALPAIRSICEERGIALIEDCAHAHGAALGPQRAGSIGLAGCFSFYPTKILTTGTGGMLTTNDAALDAYARRARVHGRPSPGPGIPDEFSQLGNDWFLDEVRSVLGLHQLRQLESRLVRRHALAAAYRERLRAVHGITPLSFPEAVQHSYYKFLVRVDQTISAGALQRRLEAECGIEVERLYLPPCHLQPVYRERLGTREGMCPVAERALQRHLCLPLHAAMTEDDVAYVASCVRALIGEARQTEAAAQ